MGYLGIENLKFGRVVEVAQKRNFCDCVFPCLMGKLINVSSLSLIVGNSGFSFFFYLLKSHSQQAIEHYHNLFEKLLYVKFP